MKPCQRLLQRLKPLKYNIHNQSTQYFTYQYRTILQYATDSKDDTTTNESPVRLSTQYPPPPLEERYSTPTQKSGHKIEPYKDVQFKPKDVDSNLPQSGKIPLDLQAENLVDKQSSGPTSPGIIPSKKHIENSIKFQLTSNKNRGGIIT